MADIEKCKIDGFIAFHIQVRGHFTKKHPELSYEEYTKNIEVLGNSDADLKRYRFRPSIEYYREKLSGKDVDPFQFEKKKR